MAHRTQAYNDKKEEDFKRLVAALAEVYDVVDNDGVHCRIASVDTYHTSQGQGFARIDHYDIVHRTWCGQTVPYPRGLKDTAVSCIGCLSESSHIF